MWGSPRTLSLEPYFALQGKPSISQKNPKWRKDSPFYNVHAHCMSTFSKTATGSYVPPLTVN